MGQEIKLIPVLNGHYKFNPIDIFLKCLRVKE